jgi:hypothetical protein
MLFHPRPIVPLWRGFPVEVRDHTLRLLAQFLRHHRRARFAAREVHDE